MRPPRITAAALFVSDNEVAAEPSDPVHGGERIA
jgi:hypothetical protein